MGNNSVLHSNCTILHSFQLCTRVKFLQILVDECHVSVCLCLCLFVQCARRHLVVMWTSCSLWFLLFRVSMSSALRGDCFGKTFFLLEAPSSWLLHLQKAVTHLENTFKKNYDIFNRTFFLFGKNETIPSLPGKTTN